MRRKQWGSQENNRDENKKTCSDGRKVGLNKKIQKHKGVAKCPILVMSFLYVIGNYI